ncbi:WD repeat-containing protein mip1 [Batrachochytrium salamandrivorans]|nr:WD repeat-containing protein mip1 [Batrachochytrium salamandrivorans]
MERTVVAPGSTTASMDPAVTVPSTHVPSTHVPSVHPQSEHNRRHESMPVVQSAKMQQEAEAAALAAAQGQEWRLRDRLKTVSVSLVLCLNIGVDPPDIVKPNPCARMECWIDPFSLPTQKALEAIGRNLQQQYEVWQSRARYRLSLDPSIEETKKLCCSLRRNAKDERILFHYNGHGVPKPTPGGEIWVFNKNYTQYIPVSVYDIQTWLGSPCIFVYDCSSAGNILVAFDKFATQRDSEMLRQHPELVRDSHLHPAGTNTGSTTSTTNNNNTKNTTIGSTSELLHLTLLLLTDWPLLVHLLQQEIPNSANGLNGSTAGPGLSGISCASGTYRHPIWDAWDLAADQSSFDLGQCSAAALSVGIFPYVLRLLQSPASELKPVLVFIWSKILAVDSSCQNDLIKDNGYTYFINILSADNNNMPVISNLSEHRAMCAFILAVFCHNYRFGQQACLKTDLLQALVPHLEDKDPLLRQWACVCLSELWKGYTDAKWAAVGSKIPEQLAMMLNDQVAEVRAAALAAIGTLFGDLEKTPAVLLIENKMAMILKCQADASALVRQELVVALSRFAHQYPTKMVHAALELIEDERRRSASTLDEHKLSGYKTVDPAKNIAQLASQVVDKIHCQLFTSVSIDASLLQTFLPTSSTSLSMGDLSGVSSGNTLPGILSNSSTGLSAISVSNSGLSASVSQVLPMPAMYGPLQPQTHVYYYAQLPHQSTTPPLLGSVPQPSSALLPGNHQRQRQLNLHRQRPASMVGMLQTGTATLALTAAASAAFGPGDEAIVLVCDVVAESGWVDAAPRTPTLGIDRVHLDASTSTVPPSHRDANGGPVYSGVNRVHPRSSMPIFARMGSSDGRSGDSGTGSRGTVGFNDGAGSALATQFLSRGEDLDDACANPNKVAFNSAFYEWSCAYFSEPQMRMWMIQEYQFIERQWRHERNNSSSQETDALYTYSSAGKFEEHMGSVPNDRPAHLVLFHSYEPLVVSADDQNLRLGGIGPANTFSNDNPKAVGSHRCNLSMRMMRPCLDWVGRWAELPTKSTSQVTGLSVDPTGIMMLAGFMDGNVKLYDRRLPPHECVVANFAEPTSRVLQVAYVGYQHQEFLMGTASGDVLLWDIRQRARTLKINVGIPDVQITAFSIHEHGLLVGW